MPIGIGCTLRLKAVQILELVEGKKGNGDDAAEEQFGFSKEDGFEIKPESNNETSQSQEETSEDF